MSKLAAWDELIAGTDCPLCYPRPESSEFVYFVKKLSVSSLYLAREQRFRGASALVYDLRHVVRIDQLTVDEWRDLAIDLRVAETAVFRALKPDHINVESLGNSVPHLHFHLFPRYKDDGRWGEPICLTNRDEMAQAKLDDSQYAEMAEQINTEMEHVV